MFRKKEKLQSYINQVWRLFKVALVIVLVLSIVLRNRYLEADAKTAMSEQELDSSLLSLSEVYTPGTIYDKKGNILMSGSAPGKLRWKSEEQAQQIPEEILRENLKKFGFDDVIHFDSFKFNDNTFTGESVNAYDLAYGCIGQGQASVTTIGLNMDTNAILNHGVLIEPYFVKSDKKQKTISVCKAEVADTVKDMMIGVMKEGTGRGFAIDGVETAFKTGTAEEGNGETQTLLVTGGILDENKPYSITVCFNHIKGGSSVDAGLIAKKIITDYLMKE